jgi:hypothetical protein
MANERQSDNGRVVEIEVTRHFAGYVGVDSGQAMLCDPTYIRDQWQGNDLSESFSRREVRDTQTDRVYAWPTDFATYAWRFNQDLEVFFDMGPDSEDEIMPTVNQLIASGRFEHVKDNKEPTGEFSYEGCCRATCSDDSFGQMNYKRGHAGAGVVFSTGCGDGKYPVYVHKATLPGWGERIIKAEIIFFDDEDLTDDEEEQ